MPKTSDITLNAPETRRIQKGVSIYRTRCRHLLNDIERKLGEGGIIRLDAKICVKAGEKMSLSIRLNDKETYSNLPDDFRSVTVFGEVVQEASSKPVTDETIREKLSALGNTSFEFVILESLNF